jgi:hypothetical protein
MIIKKKWIRQLATYFEGVTPGTRIVLGVRLESPTDPRLSRAGFVVPVTAGSTVLPPARLGPTSRRNAEGHQIIHRDQPKETAYRQVEWSWTEFHGKDRVDQSDIKDVPYQRYPRTFVPPQGVELTVTSLPNGDWLLVTRSFEYRGPNDPALLHAVNVTLEALGECEVFTNTLQSILGVQIRRLNWDLLPPGKHPWSVVHARIASVLSQRPPKSRVVVEHRIQTINRYEPKFVAIGRAGFHGYLAFGFPKLGLCVLESTLRDNATYVFGPNWEALTQLTKAEILDGSLHTDRVIHTSGWDARIARLLKGSTFKAAS